MKSPSVRKAQNKRHPSTLPRAAMSLAVLALAAGLSAQTAYAGMSYQLNTAQATPGEAVQIKGVLFNDTDSALAWTPPESLVLQWRNELGQVIRSLAHLEAPANQVNLPEIGRAHV